MPFFQGKRFAEQARFASMFTDFLADRPADIQQTLQDAYQTLVSKGIQAAEQHFVEQIPRLRAQLDTSTAPLPVIGWLGEGAMDHEPVPGPGRLLLRVGFVVLSPLQVMLQAPGPAPGSVEAIAHIVKTGPFAPPMLLDLDRDGGLVTDRAEPVNNTLLRLLALLPSAQLKVTVFDPSRLGESVNFLYELGEAAEAIIGSKVKTTDRELAQALLELEEHITFVSQKYLQGTYDSLTAYNVAAGDIAEPYRVLVLYDYPAGFSRPGGGLDDESLVRLRKIVEVGRRCGVFTMVVTDPNLASPYQDSVVNLPWLWAGQPPPPEWAALLTLGDRRRSELTLSFPGPRKTVPGGSGVLVCDDCGAPADGIHVLPNGDSPKRLALACESHDPGGEWWLLSERDDLERAVRNAAVFDRLRPGVGAALRAAVDEADRTPASPQAEIARHGESSAFVGPALAVWRYMPDEAADPSTMAAILLRPNADSHSRETCGSR